MSGETRLRSVIIGLIGLAGTEEQMLLAASDRAETGDAAG